MKATDLTRVVLCSLVLEELQAATSKERKYFLVQYEWNNCFSKVFWDRLGGKYPTQAWEQFLAAYGIKEQSIDSH